MLLSWTGYWNTPNTYPKIGKGSMYISGGRSTAVRTATVMSCACTGAMARGTGTTAGWASTGLATTRRRSQVLCPQKLSPCPLTIWTWRNGLKRLRIGLIFGKQLEHLGIKISEILKQRKT